MYFNTSDRLGVCLLIRPAEGRFFGFYILYHTTCDKKNFKNSLGVILQYGQLSRGVSFKTVSRLGGYVACGPLTTTLPGEKAIFCEKSGFSWIHLPPVKRDIRKTFKFQTPFSISEKAAFCRNFRDSENPNILMENACVDMLSFNTTESLLK